MNVESLSTAGLRRHLRARVEQALAGAGAEGAEVELAPPPDPRMGDFGFPCFRLARVLRKAPPLIAQQIAAAIEPDEIIAEAIAQKAYVNLRLRPAALSAIVLREVLSTGRRFGSDQVEPEHWMIEYSAPNTNKPLHLGHVRNNLLGASLAQLLGFYGHRVTRINLINDRGVHICKSMLAYQLWGDGATPESLGVKGDQLVGDFYVRFDRELGEEYRAWQTSDRARQLLAAWLDSPASKAAREASGDEEQLAAQFFAQYADSYFNEHSELGARVRRMLVDWERGDEQVRALWRQLNEWVLAGFEASYARMGVGFEHVQYESETYKLGKEIVEEGLQKGVLERRADGAVICDLERVGMKGEKVLLRGDGTSVYMTQDLGTAVDRFARFDIERLVYVVGDEQIYHFDVLFRVLGLIRPGLSERCLHLPYGMIRLPEGKMKSREGTVVDADDLMNEMHRLARAETLARAQEGKAHTENIAEPELELRAERIGMAALKYYLLKFSPRKSFEYDPKASIDFLGQTGPYCLFNYARTRSLLRRSGGEPRYSNEAAARLSTEQELALVRQLLAWPEVVARAAKALDPSRITEYVFELCKGFAYIFTDKTHHPIATCDDDQLRQARLLLAAAVGNVIAAALGVLGIDVLEEM